MTIVIIVTEKLIKGVLGRRATPCFFFNIFLMGWTITLRYSNITLTIISCEIVVAIFNYTCYKSA